MIPFDSLNLAKYLAGVEVRKIRTNKGISYINLPCGFDIETTSTTYKGEKFAFMYCWQLGIGDGTPVIIGRTWLELQTLFNALIEALELNEENRLVLYVHNLGYEFQFMRFYFTFSEVFSISERKPIKAVLNGGIELRDSYILSGYSLENTAKNLVNHNIKKLTETFDYSKIRHEKTPLTPTELEYCKVDVNIVTAYIAEQIEQYGNITKIPMTNTGRVRKFVRNNCYYTNKTHGKTSKGKYDRYRQIMLDLTLDVPVYSTCKTAFMGGFTHASNIRVGKVIKDVTSIDLSSSYPAVMVAEKFPMSRAREIEIESYEHYKEIENNYCLIFTAKFVGLKNKIGYECYISESKCSKVKNATIDNGRIYFADEIITTITNVDLEIMENVYSWDNLYITNCIGFRKAYLPKSIVESVLTLYQDKTQLKDVEGKEVEYMLSKGMLNSVYGMSVTDVLQNNIEYCNGKGWQSLEIDVEGTIKEYNTSKNRFLYYPWGVFITAYARRNLWTAILNVGSDYVYSDTDSVKMVNYEKHSEFVEDYNKRIIERLKATCEYYEFDTELITPKNNKGQPKPLGIWEHDGDYTSFKTLGAKRYMYLERGKYNLVVAGLSKQNGMNYIVDRSGGNHDKIFSMFNDSLYIPADRTGKNTHTYIDESLQFEVTDYLGESLEVSAESSIHLESAEFTLSLSGQYKIFLEQLRKGYIYTGLKYQ